MTIRTWVLPSHAEEPLRRGVRNATGEDLSDRLHARLVIRDLYAWPGTAPDLHDSPGCDGDEQKPVLEGSRRRVCRHDKRLQKGLTHPRRARAARANRRASVSRRWARASATVGSSQP